MNEALQEKLAEVLELGKLGVLEGVNIIKEQSPELVNQFMSYQTAMCWGGVLLGFIISSLCFWWFNYSRIEAGKCENPSDGAISGVIVGMLGTIIGVIIFICNSCVLLKIHLAPNIYIIENLLTILR